MQCQRCQFENMPGQTQCFKCGSILACEGRSLDVHPPRMHAWKRPFRRLSRVLRRAKRVPVRDKPLSTHWDWFDDYRGETGPLILSIIPGLAHAKQRRFRTVRWFVAVWLLCMVLACALFSSHWGWMPLGLGAAIHAWIALDAGLWKILDSAARRLCVLMVMFVILYAGYRLLIQAILWNFQFERTVLTIPGEAIQRGDILLLRPIEDPSPILARGTLVQFQSRMVGNEARIAAIGQIIGLPNEVVGIHQRVYHVNGIALSIEDYPVPAWMPMSDHQVTVGPGYYFVSTEYRVRGRQNQTNDAIWRLCLVSASDIDARATMLWWPLNRRHSLRPD
ncbi:MAG: hypothetical protein K9N55_14925 [Phycisphaerae bacterium]|nr:hypothetical protein [Phycisphaerae bacterium]